MWHARALWTVALAAGAVGLGALGVLGQPLVPAPTHLDGAYWKGLSAGEKQAYLAGFLAGAAAEQARAAAREVHRESDSIAISSAAMDTLRAHDALRYRFAPHVYAAQIDDFYWWQDRVSVPLVDAMIAINRTIDEQQRR
jgi:hypothetical protein